MKKKQKMTLVQKDGETNISMKIKPGASKTKASAKRRVRGRLSKEEEMEMKRTCEECV